jgi:hypothetical protein
MNNSSRRVVFSLKSAEPTKVLEVEARESGADVDFYINGKLVMWLNGNSGGLNRIIDLKPDDVPGLTLTAHGKIQVDYTAQ